MDRLWRERIGRRLESPSKASGKRSRRPCGPAIENLRKADIDQIAITDSIPLPPEKQLPNIKVISVAALLANAIRRIHEDQSISELFRDGGKR